MKQPDFQNEKNCTGFKFTPSITVLTECSPQDFYCTTEWATNLHFNFFINTNLLLDRDLKI